MLVQRVKKNLPEDLVADGTMGGSLHMERNSATASQFDLKEAGDRRFARRLDLKQGGVRSGDQFPLADFRRFRDGSGVRRVACHGKTSSMRFPDGPHVEFGPFPMTLRTYAGDRSRMGESRWLQHDGCAERLRLRETLQVARMVGTSGIAVSAEGRRRWICESRDRGQGGAMARRRASRTASDGIGEVAECSASPWVARQARSKSLRQTCNSSPDCDPRREVDARAGST